MTTTTVTSPSLTDRVAEEIRSLMGRRRISGARMAKQLGVSAAWVSYRINGVVSPSITDLEKIAAVLGSTPAGILTAASGEGTPGIGDSTHSYGALTGRAMRRPNHTAVSRPPGRPRSRATTGPPTARPGPARPRALARSPR